MKNLKKLLFTITLLGVFLITPFFTSAATIEELQAQINALMTQIKQLQAQLAELQGQPATWCHDFNVNLKIGDSGDEVLALHRALSGDDSQTPVSMGDNRFSEITASAVSGFQQKYKSEILTPLGLQYGTGFVGKATRAKLNKLYGCGVLTPTQTPTSTSTITVLSPNGGEAWQVGNTYTIKWSTNWPYGSRPTDIIVINLLAANSPHGTETEYGFGENIVTIPFAITTNTGSYDWTIPSELPFYFMGRKTDPNLTCCTLYEQYKGERLKLGVGNVYKIKISQFTLNGEPITSYVSAQPFSIVAAGTPISSITVLSPNGGENLIDGNTYTISWKSDNAPAGSTVGLRYVRMEQITKWNTGEKYWAESGFDQPLQTPPNLPPTGTFKFVPHIPCDNCGYSYHIEPVFKFYRIVAILFPPGAVNYGGSYYARDLSDNNFTVTMPAGVTRSLKITSPSKSDILMTGGSHIIKWTSSGIPADTKIRINWGSNFTDDASSLATTTNTGSYDDFGIPPLSSFRVPGSKPQNPWEDITINVVAVDKYGVHLAYDESDPFRIVETTSDYAFAPYALSLSGSEKIKKGENLTVSWTSEPDGWGILCRLWFDGTQKLITGLPRIGSYSFPTDSLTIGNSYGYAVRCFSTWTIQKYGGNMASIPDAEGNALGKSVLITQ